MFKLVSGFVGFFLATGLFWLGIVFEHRPAGWPNLAMNLGPIHWTFHLPDGPVAQLASIEAQLVAAAAHSRAVTAEQGAITVSSAQHEQAAQTAIQTRYRTIIKEVPTYVTPQIDSSYPLSWAFVRVHDAAALGVDVSAISLPAGQSDAGASTVAPSALADIIAGNYGSCHANAKQLTALQAWVRAEQAAK